MMPPITANNNIDNIAIVTMFLPPKCQKYFGFYSIIYYVFIVKEFLILNPLVPI